MAKRKLTHENDLGEMSGWDTVDYNAVDFVTRFCDGCRYATDPNRECDGWLLGAVKAVRRGAKPACPYRKG